MILVYLFLMTNGHFMCLLTIYLSSLVTCVLKSTDHFSIGLLPYYWHYSLYIILYINWALAFYQICFSLIFPLVWCLSFYFLLKNTSFNFEFIFFFCYDQCFGYCVQEYLCLTQGHKDFSPVFSSRMLTVLSFTFNSMFVNFFI